MKPIFSIYAGHDASITIYHPDRDKFYYLGLDRFFDVKHFHGFGHWEPDHPKKIWKFNVGTATVDMYPEDAWALIHHEIKRLWDIDNDYSWLIHKHRENKKRPDIMSWLMTHPCAPKWDKHFHAGNYRHENLEEINGAPHWILTHHDSHCYTAFVQSPFDKAVVFSVDGGGDDTSCQYVVMNDKLEITYKEVWRENFTGANYTTLGSRCATLIPSTKMIIDFAGKVMGLSAYAPRNPYVCDIAEGLLRHAFNFQPKYKNQRYHIPERKHWNYTTNYDEVWANAKHYRDQKYKEYCDHFNLTGTSLEGKKELDFCAGIQLALEKFYYYMVKDVLMPDIRKNDNNLVLTGGCALNVLAVRMLQREFPDINIYVPRDPEDGGLSLGLLVGWMGRNGMLDKKSIDIETPILYDYDDVPSLISKHDAVETNIEEITTLLKGGSIMGIVQGNVERGPRALGFRSIICDPSFPDQKKLINAKVKRREGYRPFAPACREEDAEKYFNIEKVDEVLHTMSSIVDVKEEYRQQLNAITHVDGTARLQTVTKETNPFFYDLLTSFDGVLLNTSFNLQGKPILNRAVHALDMLYNTNLDYVVIEHGGKLWKFQ
jgi:carbamoyltransferase